ncbi:MAG: RND transporter [Planctomycetota bacterium]|nr:RND transporter [Planctomycetota bacterium]
MSIVLLKRSAMFGALLAVAVIAVGCGHQANDSGAKQVAAEGDEHDHGDWWCAEHGIPEEQCSMCSSKAADAFKAKGDWCEDHNRAESQCFVCDPSRADKFVKLYEAKFGHEPPPREE